MDLNLNDSVFQFFLYRYPDLLEEEDVFDALLAFLQRLLAHAITCERERVRGQMGRPSCN